MFFQLSIRTRIHEDQADAVRENFASYAGRAESLPGCMRARLYTDCGDPRAILLVLEWASFEAMETHMKSEGFKRLLDLANQTSDDAEIQIHQFTPMDAAAPLWPPP